MIFGASSRAVFVGDAVDPELHAAAFEESAADATKLALRPYQPEDPGCFASRLNLILDAIRRDRPTFAPVQVCSTLTRTPHKCLPCQSYSLCQKMI